jgi:hypothetical protein
VGDFTLNLGVIANVNKALFVIDLGGLGLVILDSRLLVAQDVPDRFHNGTVLDQTSCTGGQQGSEKEEVSGGDDDDIVIFCVQLLEQGNSTPSGS